MELILGGPDEPQLAALHARAMDQCTRVQAAVAYARRHAFFDSCIERRKPLEFFGLLGDGTAVSTKLLGDLLEHPCLVDCWLVKVRYHPKVIWWHGFGAYIGSANLTTVAWERNIEAGVFIPEEQLLGTAEGERLRAFLDGLRAASFRVDHAKLSQLSDIELSRRDEAWKKRRERAARRRAVEDLASDWANAEAAKKLESSRLSRSPPSQSRADEEEAIHIPDGLQPGSGYFLNGAIAPSNWGLRKQIDVAIRLHARDPKVWTQTAIGRALGYTQPQVSNWFTFNNRIAPKVFNDWLNVTEQSNRVTQKALLSLKRLAKDKQWGSYEKLKIKQPKRKRNFGITGLRRLA